MELINGCKLITKNKILKITNRYEINLLELYINFIIKHNGGQPIKNKFKIKDIDDSLDYEFSVHVFYCFGNSDNGIENDMGIGVMMAYASFCDRMPIEIFPIGCDTGANSICIDVKDAYLGKVYLWIRENEAYDDETSSFSNVDLIDDSFNNFLNKLY